jgi:hypothetical protein
VTVAVDHTAAVIGHLQTNGLTVGDGNKPDGAGWQVAPGQSPFVGYCVVWRLGSQERRNWSLQGDYGESRPLMFVRCFGGTRVQAETLLDTVLDVMLAQTITVDNHTTIRVMLDTTTTTSRSDDIEVAMFEAGAYFRIWSDRHA